MFAIYDGQWILEDLGIHPDYDSAEEALCYEFDDVTEIDDFTYQVVDETGQTIILAIDKVPDHMVHDIW